MNNRIRISRFLLRLGSFIQTLPVVLMKPKDLIEFGRQCYGKTSKVLSWSEDYLIDSGLISSEKALISSVKNSEGNLLLLGLGGGREAIPFTKMGYQVTGVDFIPEMIDKALQNANDRGVQIKGLVQEISELDVPDNNFDLVWLSKAMYSAIPSRTRRVNMLQKIYNALKPGGELVCQFKVGIDLENYGKEEKIRKAIAKSPFGNKAYELGDILWLNIEFIHLFNSEDDIRLEIEQAGLIINEIQIDYNSYNGSVICEKPI